MTKPYQEQLSALVDDELSPAELDLLLRRGREEPEVTAQVGRYALIREAMHRNLPEQVDPSFADRVSAAIAEEPAHQQGTGLWRARWLRPVAGVAVAASVALLAIAVWPQQGPNTDDTLQNVAESPSAVPDAVAPAGQTVATDNIEWERLDNDVQSRLQQYSVRGGSGADLQLDLFTQPVGTRPAGNAARGEN